MTVQTIAAAITTNAWNWSIVEFAQKLGLEQSDPHAALLFGHFQRLAEELRRFDDRTLQIIAREE